MARDSVVLDPAVVPLKPVAPVEEPFEPVILRNINRPNLKILRKVQQTIESGPQAGKVRVTPLEPYAFINSYFRARNRDQYETVMRRCAGEVFVEPPEGPDAPEPFRYYNARDEVELTTRNRELYEAYQRKVRSN